MSRAPAAKSVSTMIKHAIADGPEPLLRTLQVGLTATLIILGVCGASVWPARAQAALKRDRTRGHSTTFLRFLDAPELGRPLDAVPKLSVSFGGAVHRAVMDTGSTGILVSADMIPAWTSLPSLGPAELTYSSSGRVMQGQWVVTPVTIAGADGAAVSTRPMPVLAVTRITCLANARDCKPEEAPRHVSMLGVGFARQGDHQAQSTPDRNPLLQLPAMTAGKLRRGYIVTRHGVHVGLGRGDTRSDFVTVPLAHSQEFDDWAAPPVCISVAGHSPPACGTVLMDTGVARSFLTVPPAQLAGATAAAANGEPILVSSTSIGLQLNRPGAPPWGYSFVVDDAANPVAPRGVTLVRPGQRPTFFNTSFHFLNGFDYLYDAEQGLVGYRRRPLLP